MEVKQVTPETLVFDMVDRKKFMGMVFKPLFPITKEEKEKAIEEFGGYVYCASSMDLNEENDLREELLGIYESELGIASFRDEEVEKRIDEINKKLRRW